MLNNNGFNGGISQMKTFQGGGNLQGSSQFQGGGQFQGGNTTFAGIGNNEQQPHIYGEHQNGNSSFYGVKTLNTAITYNQGFSDKNMMYGNNSFGRINTEMMEQNPNLYLTKNTMGNSSTIGNSDAQNSAPRNNVVLNNAVGYGDYQNSNNSLHFYNKDQSSTNYNNETLFTQVKQNVSIFGNKSKNNSPLFGNNLKSENKNATCNFRFYDFVSHDKSIFGNRLKDGKPLFMNNKNVNKQLTPSANEQHGNNYLLNNNNINNLVGSKSEKNYMNYNNDLKNDSSYGFNTSNEIIPKSVIMNRNNNINIGVNLPQNQVFGNTYNQNSNNLCSNINTIPSAQDDSTFIVGANNELNSTNFIYNNNFNPISENMQNEQYHMYNRNIVTGRDPMNHNFSPFHNAGVDGSTINTHDNLSYGNPMISSNHNMLRYSNVLPKGNYLPPNENTQMIGANVAINSTTHIPSGADTLMNDFSMNNAMHGIGFVGTQMNLNKNDIYYNSKGNMENQQNINFGNNNPKLEGQINTGDRNIFVNNAAHYETNENLLMENTQSNDALRNHCKEMVYSSHLQQDASNSSNNNNNNNNKENEIFFTNENEIMFEKKYVKEHGNEENEKENTQINKKKKIMFFNKDFIKSLELITNHNLNSYNENRSTIYSFPSTLSSNNAAFYMQAVDECKKGERFDVDVELYNKIFTKNRAEQTFSVLKNINVNKKINEQDIALDIYYPLLHVEKIKFRQSITPEYLYKPINAPFELGQIPTII
ncbi:hypothetical protein, conserved [Plasmodium gonderi]|uniref:Uncharacterized protein n=1 Tax=Plasmodium gonderi TaxID=77519 RepID=A0A1Y1JJD9_PLAGO|nr:hypothetical protein, conserved [Plasmodium gonderi]GAW82350.1 hypothetical protein, conserved [Plasmodium gonderi]